MVDNFNLRSFLTENKLTKNAQLLKEQEEGYRYFEEEGNGGFYLGTADGHKVYSMEDSSIMDTCFYAIEDPEGYVEFVGIDVAGEPVSSEDLQNEYELLSYVADLIEADIAKQLGEEDNLDEGNYSDSYDTPAAKKVHRQLQSAIHSVRSRSEIDPTIAKLVAAAEQETGSQATSSEKRTLSSQGYHIYSMNAEMERESVDNKKPMMKETKLTAKERRLVEMVNNAMGFSEGEENVDYTMGRQDDPNQLPNPAPELNIPEGEESIEEAKPLPKYNSIEELMKEIENGTNEAAHKYKMDEMKRVYEALEAKVGSLEEGEHAEHIDQKAVKQMRKDIAALRKAEEKLRKEFDKKFTGKEKKETPKKDKEVVALQEGTFDLRKFLVENKLTAGSRMVNENADTYDTDYTSAEQAVKGGKLLSSFNSPKTGINPTAMRQHIAQPQEEKYIFWYDEPGELTGTKEVTAREALQIVKAMNGEGRVPAGVPSGIAGELHSVPVRMVK